MLKTAEQIADDVLYKIAKKKKKKDKGEYRDPSEMTAEERKKMKKKHWGRTLGMGALLGPFYTIGRDTYDKKKGRTTYEDVMAYEKEQARLARKNKKD